MNSAHDQLPANTITQLSNQLTQARLNAKESPKLSESVKDLSMGDAYRVQNEGLLYRTTHGEKIVGYKMGLTSQAKREQMGLHSPIYGVLTDRMQLKVVDDKGIFSLKGSIHPKIEPEIAFLVSKNIRGVPTPFEALEACSHCFCALEILDSRYTGFKYFSLPDVVADNSSSAFFALGGKQLSPQTLDLKNLNMRLSVNGVLAHSALSSEISGNPINSVVQLCELLHAHGKYLPAGSLVLAGAATTAVALEKGMRVELFVDGLGALTVQVEE